MVTKNYLPKWATPDRRADLLELWRLYGNKCLFGHSACFDISHYIHYDSKTVWASKPVYLPCLDKAGNHIRGKYLELYTPVKVAQQEATFSRLFDVLAEQLISNWITDDREQSRAELLAEQQALHSLAEKREPLKGRFSAISAKIYAENQPLYFREGLGMSGVTLKPFAKIRMSSSYFTLYIDLGDTLRRVSKNKRRKALRYGNPLPSHIERNVDDIVKSAVRDYLD